MIHFTDVDVIVNYVGLMADSVTISEQNSLQPIYAVGYRGAQLVPNGPVQANVQISYRPAVENEPNFSIISDLRNNLVNLIPLEIAGLETWGYLKNYSLQVAPNQPAQVTVNYNCFTPVSGSITEKRGVVPYETTIENLGHGWSTLVSYDNTGMAASYSFSYDIDFVLEPIYVLGAKTPSQVLMLGGNEKIEIVKELFSNIDFSGALASPAVFSISGIDDIQIMNLSQVWNPSRIAHLTLALDDARITSSELSASLDEYTKTKITIERSF